MRAESFRIVLTQGLNRQIRRMCSALGYRVKRLMRVRIMHIRLGDLPSGDGASSPKLSCSHSCRPPPAAGRRNIRHKRGSPRMRWFAVSGSLAAASLVAGALCACVTAKGASYAEALAAAGVTGVQVRIVVLRPDQRYDDASLSRMVIRIDEPNTRQARLRRLSAHRCAGGRTDPPGLG